MDFQQPGPILRNQYRDDRVLREFLSRAMPPASLALAEADYDALGEHAARAWESARRSVPALPSLVQWDAWGARVDRIAVTPVWQQGAAMATRFGLVAAGHEPAFGALARIDQFVRVYLYHVASEFFTCPLAMSDGAATALKAAADAELRARAVPRLLSRDPASLWLSGQWMTELPGGSDVGRTETVARRADDGTWRLHGRKWFTSAVVGDMALALARPEGGGPGSAALALFLVETRDAAGGWNGIRIDRLKDKLGTRELPTAEIHLDDCRAELVGEPAHGVRLIAPVLTITRSWNAVCALATMRRCIALAIDHAHRREAFGRLLIEQPLHRATLARMQAAFEAAFQLVFHAAGLLGAVETGAAGADDEALLRVLVPLAKLWTGKLAVAIASETCEAFGGAGYIEDTGIPQLLRDAQVYPIWEGTTNVLALDCLRALGSGSLDALLRRAESLLAEAGGDPCGIGAALRAAADWHEAQAKRRADLEAGARGLAMTLARAWAAALLARHAASLPQAAGDAARAALALFARDGLVRLGVDMPATDRLLSARAG